MKRNVLWMTMDHVTFHHYRHLQGALPTLATYEKLCAQGTEFTRCKSAHPLCLPCRASMLTGVYTHKHGLYRNGKLAPNPAYPTAGELLRAHGYRAGYFGKNHSSYDDLMERGFEGWTDAGYGNPYISAAYADYLARGGYERPVYVQQWHMQPSSMAISAFADGRHDLTQADDFNNNNAGYLDTRDPVHESDFLVSLAEGWLHENRENPFVLRVDVWGPHHAYQPPLSVYGSIDPEKVALPPSLHAALEKRPDISRQFRAHCEQDVPIQSDATWRYLLARAYEQYTYVDQALGRLVKALTDLGLAGNTAILLTADHGDALGTAGGLFDKAGDMQEEVMEIPMALYVPWQKGNGQKVDALTSNLDVLPTVLDLIGAEIPAHVDGQSLYALAQGSTTPRESLMCEHYGHFQAYTRQRTLYHGQYKLIVTQNDADQLYDLSIDPHEMRNLAGEGEHETNLREMHRLLAREQSRYNDTNSWYQPHLV